MKKIIALITVALLVFSTAMLCMACTAPWPYNVGIGCVGCILGCIGLQSIEYLKTG